MQKKMDDHKFDLAIEAPVNNSKILDQITPLLHVRENEIFEICEFEQNYSNYHSGVLNSMGILSNGALNSIHSQNSHTSQRGVNEANEEAVVFDLESDNHG